MTGLCGLILLFGTRLPAFSQEAAHDPLAQQLTDLAIAVATGGEPVGAIVTGSLSEGASYFEDVLIEGDRCYAFLAVGEMTAEDIDLHLYSQSVELGDDVEEDPTPSVFWCNAYLTEVTLEVRMYSGSGRFALEVFAFDEPSEDVDPALSDKLELLSAQFAGGLVPALSAIAGNGRAGETQTYDIQLVPGRCYVLLAASSRSLEDLDLYLVSPDGRLVDFDDDTEGDPVLRYCVPSGEEAVHQLRVNTFSGFGQYLLGVYAQ